MYTKQVTVSNQDGLHSSAATYFIQKANEFGCRIWIEMDSRKVNAKSLLGVMSMGVIPGAAVTLSADGAEEEAAVETLAEMLR